MDKCVPMKKQLYILLIALMIGGRGMAERIETVDGFQGATTSSVFNSTIAKEYVGGQTTWYVTNGSASDIKVVADKLGNGQKAIGLQLNDGTEYHRGTLTSGYIVGLKELGCKIFTTHSSVQGRWDYSTDGSYWKTFYSYSGYMTTPFTSNVPITQEILEKEGVYIRLVITSGSQTSDRIYVDDIRMVTEVEDECENCFPITL